MILDKEMKVLILQRSKYSDAPFEIKKKLDFSGHGLFSGDWLQLQLSSKAITYGDTIFEAKTNATSDKNDFKFFRWDHVIH